MKNWEKRKLGDICGFVRGPFGGSLKKNIFKPEGYAVYEQQHAIYDQFNDESPPKTPFFKLLKNE